VIGVNTVKFEPPSVLLYSTVTNAFAAPFIIVDHHCTSILLEADSGLIHTFNPAAVSDVDVTEICEVGMVLEETVCITSPARRGE
jgi:hypothetical protein